MSLVCRGRELNLRFSQAEQMHAVTWPVCFQMVAQEVPYGMYSILRHFVD